MIFLSIYLFIYVFTCGGRDGASSSSSLPRGDRVVLEEEARHEVAPRNAIKDLKVENTFIESEEKVAAQRLKRKEGRGR